ARHKNHEVFSAASRNRGRGLPRSLARRRTPAFSSALEEYLARIDGGRSVSNICESKDTFAALGNAEVLTVKDSPGHRTSGPRHVTCICPSFPWRENLTPLLPGKRCQETAETISFVTWSAP